MAAAGGARERATDDDRGADDTAGGATAGGADDTAGGAAAGGADDAATAALGVVVWSAEGTETIEIPAPAAGGALFAAQGIVSITVWVTVEASSVIVVIGAAPWAKTVVVKKENWLERP